jgi:transcriptional regulator with XRE-family HTH domain
MPAPGRPKSVAQPMDKHIGARIRQRRVQLGISQEKLAHGLGVTFQQVQKYEKGTNRVSGSRMAQIAEVLEVQPAFFFAGAAGQSVEGHRHNPDIERLDSFLASKDGQAISRLFPQIKSALVRRDVILLLQHLVATQK